MLLKILGFIIIYLALVAVLSFIYYKTESGLSFVKALKFSVIIVTLFFCFAILVILGTSLIIG